MSKPHYLDVVVNSFKSGQAWKAMALVMLGAFFILATAFIWVASQRTVLLVPQHLSAPKGGIRLNIGAPFAPDYLRDIAYGDLFTLLSWTPENIDEQYELFIGRLTPSLHDAQREVLLTEAKTHKEEGLTQSFFPTRSYIKGDTATVHGVLVRNSGGREIFRGMATFAVTYANAGNGYLQIAGVTQPKDSKAAK